MPKANLKTHAYTTIREKIITCEYAPGAFLNEEMLTEQLGASRTPVRDALSRLEQEGLVHIMPKKGVFITPLSISDINMIFEIRDLYETYCLKNYGGRIPGDQLQYFYNLFLNKEASQECYHNNNYFYQLDDEFHHLFISACPNQYIKNNYELIHSQNTRFRYMTGTLTKNRMAETLEEHLSILHACLRSDWNLASEKLIYHLEESKKATIQLVLDVSDNTHIGL